MTILVCDDDKEIVDAIEIYLIQEGYQVVKAYDGEQALDMLRTKKIDLMVIDVMMPKLDGIRATFQARKTSSIPIIILSAKTEDADNCCQSVYDDSCRDGSRIPCGIPCHQSWNGWIVPSPSWKFVPRRKRNGCLPHNHTWRYCVNRHR